MLRIVTGLRVKVGMLPAAAARAALAGQLRRQRRTGRVVLGPAMCVVVEEGALMEARVAGSGGGWLVRRRLEAVRLGEAVHRHRGRRKKGEQLQLQQKHTTRLSVGLSAPQARSLVGRHPPVTATRAVLAAAAAAAAPAPAAVRLVSCWTVVRLRYTRGLASRSSGMWLGGRTCRSGRRGGW